VDELSPLEVHDVQVMEQRARERSPGGVRERDREAAAPAAHRPVERIENGRVRAGRPTVVHLVMALAAVRLRRREAYRTQRDHYLVMRRVDLHRDRGRVERERGGEERNDGPHRRLLEEDAPTMRRPRQAAIKG
jgi:hypothetical protein